MTDLSDFGVDVETTDPEPDQPDADEGDTGRTYPNGRCPAIATSTRQRCAGNVSRMNAADGFCGVHRRERDPWTIHDHPEKLILVTGELDALSLDEVDPDAVDFDLARVRAAVRAVAEEPWLEVNDTDV